VHLYGNAKLVPSIRRLLVARVLGEHCKVADVAAGFGISERTVYRWLARWRAGDRRLLDRSSAPKRVPRRTPKPVEALIEQLRRLRMTSTRIAAELRMAVSTVGAVLARLGLNRLSRLDPPEPPNRYQRRRPGELVHLDVKKLGRFRRPGHRVTGRDAPGWRAQIGAGWEFVHVAVDDCSRLAYVEILDDEPKESAVAFLSRALAWFAERAVAVNEIMTDNGSCYVSRAFAAQCHRLRLRHLRTRPNRPRTNGKAERFIQTMLRQWAYAATYRTSHHRGLALQPWLDYYNHRRPHGPLGHQPPASRLSAA
jgi:transposase InsO family protein